LIAPPTRSGDDNRSASVRLLGCAVFLDHGKDQFGSHTRIYAAVQQIANSEHQLDDWIKGAVVSVRATGPPMERFDVANAVGAIRLRRKSGNTNGISMHNSGKSETSYQLEVKT
jgi:hypothetical protein